MKKISQRDIAKTLLWGQNEGTIAGNTQYIIFGSSFKNIVGTN